MLKAKNSAQLICVDVSMCYGTYLLFFSQKAIVLLTLNFWRIHSIAWKRNVKAETRNNFIWGKIHFMDSFNHHFTCATHDTIFRFILTPIVRGVDLFCNRALVEGESLFKVQQCKCGGDSLFSPFILQKLAFFGW